MDTPVWKHRLSKTLQAGLRELARREDRRLPDLPRPSDDPFYRAEPAEELAGLAPGALLGSRPITLRSARMAAGVEGWHLRFRSTDTDGEAISAVATLLVPRAQWSRASGGSRRAGGSGAHHRPLVAYQCAIDSLGEKSDPSYTVRRGNQREMPVMRFALHRGWAVVTADYTGPRRAYGAGLIAGQITLDAIRASLAFVPSGLDRAAPVGLWGYSGGGQATAWAAEQHPSYAPDINLAAVAAGGVPTDERALRRIDGGFFSGLALGGITGIDREYPQTKLETMLSDEGRAVLREIADMSVDELVAYFPFRRIDELTTVPSLLDTDEARATAAALTLGQALPTAPIYLYHSCYDQLVPITGAEELAARYRAGGVDVTMRRSRLGEHVVFAGVGIPGALRFLAARLGRSK